MKKGSQFKGLLKELGRDPRLKRIISKCRTRGKGEARVENMSGIVLLILAIAARFATKKKARALDELMDIIYLLVQVSLVLKENVFDRPEVKAFLSHRSKEVYSLSAGMHRHGLAEDKRTSPHAYVALAQVLGYD